MKKVELHRHFEGCISPQIFHNLVIKNYPESKYVDLEEIKMLYSFSDFQGFLDAFGIVVRHIKTYDDFKFLAESIAEDLLKDNIIYTEFLFSPEPFIDMNLDTKTILSTILQALSSQGCKTGLVIDLVRQAGYDSTLSCLKEIIAIRKANPELHHWIKGISIGGNEVQNPASLFVDHFDLARANNMYLAAHAGEWAGSTSVWDAIKLLGVSRIGHGITSLEDPNLVKYLITNQVTLDVSMTSNYLTGVAVRNKHPVVQLFKYGCKVTLNTDDPGFFDTGLTQEYMNFVAMGNSVEDLQKIVKNAIEGSFLDDSEKTNLYSELENQNL